MPKAAFLVWEIVNWIVFVPTIVLCAGIVRMKPGAGPQGGEFYFCSLFVLAGWLVLAGGGNAAMVFGGSAARVLVASGSAVILGGIIVAIAFKLLNDASLVRAPDSHLGLALSGAGLLVLLALANAVAPRVAAMIR